MFGETIAEFIKEEELKTPRSTLMSRNIVIAGKRTSVRLEPEMWQGLKEITNREHATIHEICSLIDEKKNKRTSLTAAIRVFVMLYFKAAATEQGHSRAGHGDFESMMRRAKVSAELRIRPALRQQAVPFG
ncbi:MAG: hypothetical protein GC136_03750 [Alphaproteobacteria bacterium]|nr:hypothetical protein [Alphaproteobacteria bacterium]